MKLSACGLLPLRPINAIWYRAIATEHRKTALSTDHTPEVASRFSPGALAKSPFEILYLAENPIVALYEVGALFGPPEQAIADPAKKIVTLDVKVVLQSVADFSDRAQRNRLGVSAQELTGNWDTYQPGQAPTQRLGAALFATKGLEGFVAISAKMPRCRTLIVFPQKLRPGSELVFDDTFTGKRKRYRIGPRLRD